MRGGMGLDIGKTVGILNQIVEIELAGAVRYTQYSLMVFGHGRIPIQAWMREQANDRVARRFLLCGARISMKS